MLEKAIKEGSEKGINERLQEPSKKVEELSKQLEARAAQDDAVQEDRQETGMEEQSRAVFAILGARFGPTSLPGPS